jgi:hypothetical protein
MNTTSRTLVRFGEEKIGQSATFDLTGKPTSIISGAPGIQNLGGLDEFNKRFTGDKQIKNIMAMYWKIDLTDTEKTVSYDPKTKKYRAPCAPNHIALLTTAFTAYRNFVDNLHSKEAASEEKNALKIQLDRVDAYLAVLKSPGSDCIGSKETAPKPRVSTDAGTLWHTVLPKIFKILYDKGKNGQKDVSIQEIRDEYDSVNGDIKSILEGMRAEGAYGDSDGMRATAESVVELFNLLQTLFPDIFNKFTGTATGTSPIAPIKLEETLGMLEPKIQYLDQSVKDCIKNSITSAVDNYNNKNFKSFWANIASAFDCFKTQIEELKKKISGLETELADAKKACNPKALQAEKDKSDKLALELAALKGKMEGLIQLKQHLEKEIITNKEASDKHAEDLNRQLNEKQIIIMELLKGRSAPGISPEEKAKFEERIRILEAEVKALQDEIALANKHITDSLSSHGMNKINDPDTRNKVADRIQKTIDAYRAKIQKLQDGDSDKDKSITALLRKIHDVSLTTKTLDEMEGEMEGIRKDPVYAEYLKTTKDSTGNHELKPKSDILFGLKKQRISKDIQAIIQRLLPAETDEEINKCELELMNYFGGTNKKHISEALINSTNSTVQSINAAKLYKKTLEEISGAIGKKDALEKIKAGLPANKLTELKRVAPIETIINELIKSVRCEENSVEFKRMVAEITADPSDDTLSKINVDASTTLADDEKSILKKLIAIIRAIHASSKVYTKIITLISETIKLPEADRKWPAITDAIGALDPADPVKPELELIVKTLSSISLISELFNATKAGPPVIVLGKLLEFKGSVNTKLTSGSEKTNLIGIADNFIAILQYNLRHAKMTKAIRDITDLFKKPIPEPPPGTELDAYIERYFTDKFTSIIKEVDDDTDRAVIQAMTEVIVPNAKNCGPFIKIAVLSAKTLLYQQMIEHMEVMMHKMGEHASKLQGLLDPADLKEKLDAEMLSKYNHEIDFNEQEGVKTFDTGINRLIEYLKVLDDNYEQWVKCICKDGLKWNPATKECSCGAPRQTINGVCKCPKKMEYNPTNNTCACPDGQHQKDGTGDCVGQMKLHQDIQYDIILHLSKILNTKDSRNMNAPLTFNSPSHFHLEIYKYLGHELTEAAVNKTNNADQIDGTYLSENYFSINKIPYDIEIPKKDEPNAFSKLKNSFITKLLNLDKGSINEGERTHSEPNYALKTRQVFFILYKIALNFINNLVCNGEEQTCVYYYIQAVYDIFNFSLTINSNKIRVFDKLFNPFPKDTPNYINRKAQLIELFNFIGTTPSDNIIRTPYSTTIKTVKWNEIMVGPKAIVDIITKQAGGARVEVSFGPDDIPQVLAQQVAWEEMNKQYNSLEPEYQQMLPEPEPAPIHSLTEPIHRFIDDFAEEDPLEEARETIGLLAPHEIDDLMANDKGVMDRIKQLYKKAIPAAKEEWIPILVRADSLRTLL